MYDVLTHIYTLAGFRTPIKINKYTYEAKKKPLNFKSNIIIQCPSYRIIVCDLPATKKYKSASVDLS